MHFLMCSIIKDFCPQQSQHKYAFFLVGLIDCQGTGTLVALFVVFTCMFQLSFLCAIPATHPGSLLTLPAKRQALKFAVGTQLALFNAQSAAVTASLNHQRAIDRKMKLSVSRS